VRYLLIGLFCVLLVGCGFSESSGTYTKPSSYERERLLKEKCIYGVVYYVSGNSSLAPAFKPDGTLFTC
jgi:hypothetical protein